MKEFDLLVFISSVEQNGRSKETLVDVKLQSKQKKETITSGWMKMENSGFEKMNKKRVVGSKFVAENE